MPKHDSKRQKSILNYFSSQAKECPQREAHNVVTNSLEAMTLDIVTDPKEEIKVVKTPIKEESEDEEEEIVISRNKRKRRLKRVIEEESSNSEFEADIPISVRLAKLKQQHQQRQKNLSFLKHEHDDVVEQCDKDDNRIIHDEELDFLDKSDILQERTRGRKASRYTEALKKLTNRKSKLDSYQGESGPIEKYSTSNKNIIISDEDNDGSESDNNNSDDLEGFVVDDDIIDGEKNAAQDSEMTMMEMPAEFTKARSNSFSKQLKIYLEYLVALSLNPILDTRSNPQYEIAKNAVLRRVQGYKDSIVTSDVWLTSFKEAVDKYSQWKYLPRENLNDEIWGIDLITCEACRSNKPASTRVLLSSDDSPNSITLCLGSECCRKGQLYHQLYHFELHMYNNVKSKVVTEMMMMQSDRRLQQQLKDNSTIKQQTILIYNKLRKSGYIKTLRMQVRDLFNTVVLLYNLKSQRSRIVDDSSSSSSTSCSENNDISSSED